MAKYSVLVIVGLTLAMLACSDDGPSLNPPSNQSYPVEKDPVYSADSNAVFFVSVDTVHAERTAILYAEADMPIRRRLAIGSGIAVTDQTSLSISPAATKLLYLTAGLRHVCTLATQPSCSVETGADEESAAFLTDSVLILSRNDSMFIANLAADSLSFVARGWEPRLKADGQVVYASEAGGSAYAVLRYRANGIVDTIYRLSGQARPRWPDVDTTGNWLVYTMDSIGSYLVHVVDLAQKIDRRVAVTKYPRSCIVSQMLVLFTGANGFLYQVNYRGSNAIPWVYVDEG